MGGVKEQCSISFINFTESPKVQPMDLHDVRQKMTAALDLKKPIGMGDVSTLDDLAEQIFSMYRSGFSFEEISEFLYKCGVVLGAQRMRDYYSQIQASRLLNCEKLLAGHMHLGVDEKIERAIFVESQLRLAIQEQQGMHLHYQPQIDMHTGQVIGAEALLRLNINGLILSPVEAIPIAEKSGLIIPIGEWVFREACREAKRWSSMNLGGQFPIKIAINLSAKQLSEQLPMMIHSAICDVGLPTRLLALEITESFLVGNESIGILHSLRESGIHLSIDDFGTGYSCLSEIKDMPLDTIKIDRSFVNAIEEGGSSLAVIEAIIDIARKLEMTTLAEGVESAAQVKILKSMGCSIAQGFYYSKPLPADEFIKFVNRNSHANLA